MTVAAIFFCFQVIVGLLNLLLADIDAAPAYWLFFLFAAFSGVGVILALNGRYSGARGFVVDRWNSVFPPWTDPDPGRESN